MKKLIFFFAMVSIFTSILTAQIKMESFEWKTKQIKSYPRDLCIYAQDMEKLLTFEKDYSVFKTPHLYSTLLYSKTGPQFYVQIDSSLYHLNNYAPIPQPYSQVSREWICSITVLKKSIANKIYGYEGEDGMVIIRLHSNYEDDFLNGKLASNPIRIKINQ